MIRRRILLPALAIVAAACAFPSAAEAQRWFAGAGGALAAIANTGNETTAFRPGVHAAIGYGVGKGVAVGIEGSLYGLGDEEPRTSDFIPGTSTFTRRPEVVETRTLFAFVQVDAGPVYLRPGVGIGMHASPSYLFGPGDQVLEASVTREGGLAAGLTAGYAVPIGHRASVNFEGVAVWSGGEDSTSDRRVYGLRIVPTFTL